MAVKRRIRRKLRRKAPAVKRKLGARSSSAKSEVNEPSSLMIGGAHDPAEKAADHMAARVLTAPGLSLPSGSAASTGKGTPSAVHRKCASCEAEEKAKVSRKAATGVVAPGTASSPATKTAAKAIGSLGTGRGLNRSETAFFEPRFGRNFSSVRIHEGAKADRASRAIDAKAFTKGNDVAFAKGQRTNSTMAHELAHVVQDGGATRRLVRRSPFNSCETGSACKPYEKGETKWAKSKGINSGSISSPLSAFMVWNFPVGSSSISGLDKTKAWAPKWGDMVLRNATYEILGFSDCVGSESNNVFLRAKRAVNILNELPKQVRKKITRFAPAPSNDCIDTNTSKQERSHNRSVVIRQLSENITFPDEHVDVSLPVYICSKPLDTSPVGNHALFRIGSSKKGSQTYSLQPSDLVAGVTRSTCIQGEKGKNYPSDKNANATCFKSKIKLSDLNREYKSYPTGRYCTYGPNSNTFVGHIARAAGEKRRPSTLVPGWDDRPPISGTYAPGRYATLLGCASINCTMGGSGELEPYLPRDFTPQRMPDGGWMDDRGIVTPGIGPKF